MANSADPDLQKPTDLDLHCLQKQGIFRFSRTRVKNFFLLRYKIKASKFSQTSMVPTTLGSWKYVLVMGVSATEG